MNQAITGCKSFNVMIIQATINSCLFCLSFSKRKLYSNLGSCTSFCTRLICYSQLCSSQYIVYLTHGIQGPTPITAHVSVWLVVIKLINNINFIFEVTSNDWVSICNLLNTHLAIRQTQICRIKSIKKSVTETKLVIRKDRITKY